MPTHECRLYMFAMYPLMGSLCDLKTASMPIVPKTMLSVHIDAWEDFASRRFFGSGEMEEGIDEVETFLNDDDDEECKDIWYADVPEARKASAPTFIIA